MLTKRRICPPSSTMRSRSPGNWRSSSSITAPTVAASACTSAAPLVIALSGVGILTSTAIGVSFRDVASPRLDLGQQAVEGGQRRPDGRGPAEDAVEHVRCLEAVAGDADHHRLAARDAPGVDQL